MLETLVQDPGVLLLLRVNLYLLLIVAILSVVGFTLMHGLRFLRYRAAYLSTPPRRARETQADLMAAHTAARLGNVSRQLSELHGWESRVGRRGGFPSVDR